MGSFTEAYAWLLTRPPTTAGGRDQDRLDPFVNVLTVLLDQVADARTARRLLDALSQADLLNPEALRALDPTELDDLLTSVGVRPNLKRRLPLRRLAEWAATHLQAGGDLAVESLRAALLEIRGIGPATADALLLFGLGLPTYPVDRASYRILARHAWIDDSAGYDEARDLLLQTTSAADLSFLSSRLTQIGRDHCKVGRPRCEDCPLRPFLPPSGPIDPGAGWSS